MLAAAGFGVDAEGGRLVVHDDDQAGRELAAGVNRTAHQAGIVLAELSPIRTSLEDRYWPSSISTQGGS